MKNIHFALLIILSLFFITCEIINPEEDIPAYLTVEPFQYSPGTDGIQSTKITDGWIYIDQQFLGAFDLPHTFPVLAEGETEILIDPGIKDNGISASPDIYPFYQRYITTVNLVPGEITTIQPSTTYDPDTRFLFREDFEGNAHRLNDDIDQNPNTKVVFDFSTVKEGDKSGKMELDTVNSILLVGTNKISEPVQNGAFAFIEMDYKTDVPILMGILGYDDFGQVNFTQVDFGVNASEDWNKIYFNVSALISGVALAGAQTYQIVFQAQLPRDNGEFTLENAEIYLDNLKLVTF